MSPGDAVSDALDALAAERGAYRTLADTAAALGGRAAAARAFGVTRRTVERWLTKGAEKRKPSAANVKIIAAVNRKLDAQQLNDTLREGFSVTSYFELCISDDCSWRDKSDIEIDDPDDESLDLLTQAYEDNDREGMANAWQTIFLGGWGQGRLDGGRINDIDGLGIATRG